CLLLYGGAMLF
nr:immunoglobulin light chain junction region [Macaca mulatta]